MNIKIKLALGGLIAVAVVGILLFAGKGGLNKGSLNEAITATRNPTALVGPIKQQAQIGWPACDTRNLTFGPGAYGPIPMESGGRVLSNNMITVSGNRPDNDRGVPLPANFNNALLATYTVTVKNCILELNKLTLGYSGAYADVIIDNIYAAARDTTFSAQPNIMCNVFGVRYESNILSANHPLVIGPNSTVNIEIRGDIKNIFGRRVPHPYENIQSSWFEMKMTPWFKGQDPLGAHIGTRPIQLSYDTRYTAPGFNPRVACEQYYR
ncbi:hypothetical protein KBD59_04170 [Candidatus Gracilibacteria bacterium]|nr:hypothetical protein [Candidatus Gracilibacteria bacterium]